MITIDIVYIARGIRVTQGGSFPVHLSRFRREPDKEAVRIAAGWIKQIKKLMKIAAAAMQRYFPVCHEMIDEIKREIEVVKSYYCTFGGEKDELIMQGPNNT
jgi:hypothetical protein